MRRSWNSPYRESKCLRGGYYCRINNTEANEWHEHMLSLDAYERLIRLSGEYKAQEALAQSGSQEAAERLTDLNVELARVDEELYAAGKVWDEARLARLDAEADEAEKRGEIVDV